MMVKPAMLGGVCWVLEGSCLVCVGLVLPVALAVASNMYARPVQGLVCYLVATSVEKTGIQKKCVVANVVNR